MNCPEAETLRRKAEGAQPRTTLTDMYVAHRVELPTGDRRLTPQMSLGRRGVAQRSGKCGGHRCMCYVDIVHKLQDSGDTATAILA